MLGKPCTQSTIEEVVRQLIALSAKTSLPMMEATEIPQAMESTLSSVMALLSVEGFLTVTVKLLADGTSQVGLSPTLLGPMYTKLIAQQDIDMALGVFQKRLPLIRPDLRTKSAAIFSDIIKRSATLLSPSSANAVIALSTLRAIVTSAVSTEDAALSQIIPRLVEAASKLGDSAQVSSALSVIEITVYVVEFCHSYCH